MALVTRVAMGTLNNRRFINMATVPVGTAKNFSEIHQKCGPGLQYCNGKEKQPRIRNPGSQFQFQ